MTDVRPLDTGTVSARPDGRFWARLPRRHKRKSLGIYDTHEEAAAVLAAALRQLDGAPLPADTLVKYGLGVLKIRKESGFYRGVDREVTRWNALIGKRPLGKLAVAEVTPEDVRTWLGSLRKRDGSPMGAQTLSNALGLLRMVFTEAIETRVIESNPTADVRVPKAARRIKVAKWTWLRLEEIARLETAESIPIGSRLFWIVAIYTGLRAGELCGLRWSDVDFGAGSIHVQRSRAHAPKSGRDRHVQLLEPAADALRAWRAIATGAGLRSHLDLVFPSPHGGHHADGYDAEWSKYRAGLGINARFHDFRHTCASHLLQGSWAPDLIERALRLEEVRDWLGHSDISITQRYAHLCSDGIRSLVKRPPAPSQEAEGWGTTGVQNLSHFGELNPGPTVYETVALPLS